MKSTLPFLCLLLLTAGAWKIWRAWPRRELLYIVVPPVIYFSFCVASKLDLGVRHLLPVYPFFIVLAGAGAAALLARPRAWAAVAVALLTLHAGSSLWAYPAYTAYSNEAWGGTNATYKVLNDSNIGWFAGLKEVASYVRAHHISDAGFWPAARSIPGTTGSPASRFRRFGRRLPTWWFRRSRRRSMAP